MDIFANSVIDRFRGPDGSVLGIIPEMYGRVERDNPANYCEVDYLLRSVLASGSRFRMLALGAAPGEWAIRAERAFSQVSPSGDYMTFNVEADPVHIRIMEDYFKHNGTSFSRNIILYAAAGEKDGWAYFPIVPENSWGAGIVSFSSNGSDLDQNLTLRDHQKTGAYWGTDELRFRGVMTIALDNLLARTGPIDFLHCDIQGAEEIIFPAHIKTMGDMVTTACISVHSSRITDTIRQCFGDNDWTLRRDIPGKFIQGPHGEETHEDGVLIFTNNRRLQSDGSFFA